MAKKINLKPIVLVVLDGWGEWNTKIGNPASVAKLPTIDKLNSYYPKLLLEASGLAVGLPWGVFGNSEVGHQTMGAGQIIYHYLPTITGSIQSRSFFNNAKLKDAFNKAKKRKSRIHFLGLASNGGVHSHIDHLFALIKMAKEQKFNDTYIHAITDGRDTPPADGVKFIESIQKYIDEQGVGKIATVIGRYYAMDRNNNWDRVEEAYAALTKGKGIKAHHPIEAMEKSYSQKEYDEYLKPIVIVDEVDQPVGQIKPGDVVINFNFRADRARQITRAFAYPDFDKFKHCELVKNIHYLPFTEYEENMPVSSVFPPQKITARIGEILSKHNMRQLRIAETEKYAHVTYFFNGGEPEPFKGEDRIFIPSKNAKSYADIPEMSAYEVTDKLLKAITGTEYDFVLVNYANPDMVGHTGVFSAGIKALEVVDSCLDRLISTVFAIGGCLLITADHGNVEEMINLETGEIDTKHSNNPVPFWFVSPSNRRKEANSEPVTKISGMLADIAATILDLAEIDRPKDIIGESLMKYLHN